MNHLRELYQEVIVDHGRHPRNFGSIENPSCEKEGYNPLCGDKLKIFILLEGNIIKDIKFEGEGCAISMASASIMSQSLTGKSIEEAEHIFTGFHTSVTDKDAEVDMDKLGKIAVLAGVKEYPARVKCATLAWHTLIAALNNDNKSISTE